VVLKGVRGPELARKIRMRRPDIKLLFASGYAGELHPERDRLIIDSELLPKPFVAEQLLDAVRRRLHG
jgi:two-component SAPR family response regulator